MKAVKLIAVAALLSLLLIPSARAAALESGEFNGAGGVKIGYLYRPGQGPAILVVHGTILGIESLKQGVGDFFPGRPVMGIYRRGYSPSGLAAAAKSDVVPLNVSDVATAVDIARTLGGGGKVGIMAYSLGALLLPETDPNKILWVALVNPAAPGMLGYMKAEQVAASWGLRNGYGLSRYWGPHYQESWMRSMAGALIDDLVRRIQAQQPAGQEEFSEFLIARIGERRRSLVWQELIVQERLCALFPENEPNLPRGVPVFIGASRSDGLIPQGAHDELVGRLSGRATRLADVRWPGGHLSPMFEPDLLLQKLSDFDREVREMEAVK
ncbi:MAG: alpha/beta fold hydrolase [Elusimicrobiota bacterium]